MTDTDVTNPMSDSEYVDLYFALDDMTRDVVLLKIEEHVLAVVRAERDRLREWFRVSYGDSSPFDCACAAVDAAARGAS